MCASGVCDIFDALALDPRDHHKISTSNTRRSDRSSVNPCSDQDDESIPVSNHALRAASTCIAQAASKAATQNWYIASRPAPRPCINPTTHDVFETKLMSSVPNPKSESRKSQKSLGQRKSKLFGEVSSIRSPFSRSVPPRWNLRDFATTMAEILSNKTFNREAYELSLRKKQERENAKVERAHIISSIWLIGNTEVLTTAQSDPLYQNGFTSLKRGQRSGRRARSIILTPPATPEPQDLSTKTRGSGRVKPTNSSTGSVNYDNVLYPTPLRIRFPSPLRFQSGHLSPPDDHPLPKLPDSPPAILPPQKVGEASPGHRLLPKDRPLPKLPDSPPAVLPLQKINKSPPGISIPKSRAPGPPFITLPSTPFTLNSPLFRHGPIQIQRRQQYFSPADESLDWTAFQISMIGVLDDYENRKDEVGRWAGEAELDDLDSWFSGFGFEIGCMEKEGPDGWIKAYI